MSWQRIGSPGWPVWVADGPSGERLTVARATDGSGRWRYEVVIAGEAGDDRKARALARRASMPTLGRMPPRRLLDLADHASIAEIVGPPDPDEPGLFADVIARRHRIGTLPCDVCGGPMAVYEHDLRAHGALRGECACGEWCDVWLEERARVVADPDPSGPERTGAAPETMNPGDL